MSTLSSGKLILDNNSTLNITATSGGAILDSDNVTCSTLKLSNGQINNFTMGGVYVDNTLIQSLLKLL